MTTKTITVELPDELFDTLGSHASQCRETPEEHALRILEAGLSPLFAGLWFRGRPRLKLTAGGELVEWNAA